MSPEETTRAWQRIIALENKLQSYDAFFVNISASLKNLEKSNITISELKTQVDKYTMDLHSMCTPFSALDALCDTVDKRIDKLESNISHNKDWSIWDFLKKK